jgi:transposase
MDATSSPQVRTDTAPATLFVALELSRSTWLVALHSPVVDKVSQHRLEGGDTEGLLALITRKRLQAAQKLGRSVRVACCFEAGYDGFWLHRWLCSRGVENRVLDAASILVDRRARRAKTDRLDVGGLLRTLMALQRGETQVCRVVHVPSLEQEDARRRSRERARLVVERGQHTSRIKGLLLTQGIRDFEPTRRDWQARLEALRTPDGQPLRPCLQAELLRECRRLRQVMAMIAEVEAEQEAVAAAEAGIAARLARLRGIGPTLAAVLGNEVFFRDFRNRREVGAYLGLAPSPWQSGQVERDQGGHRQVGQPAGEAHRHRAGLAVAAAPTRQRAGAVVPRARGGRQGPPAPDHAGRPGEEADRLVVALRDLRDRAGGRGPEGLNEFAAAAPRAVRDEAGWVWTGAPQGHAAVKKMGSILPASHSPTHVGRWSGTLRGPTGYKVVR